MPPKESPTHNGGVIASLVKCCSAKFSHTVYEQVMILSASFLDCLFLHFLKFFSQVTITYYYCQVCARPLWLALDLLFCPFLSFFCPVFALSMYICMLCVFVCIFVCLCVFLCVFPLEWNILCCIYAIYCTFYRTYVLVLQYLALYGIICLQLNSGYVKTALICPHNPILVFLAFLAFQSSRAL